MYVLLGSNGNITSKAARKLREAGRKLRVLGRKDGDIADTGFLAQAFRGATAVYTMIPPDYAAADMHARQDQLGESIARAVAASGVKRVVNLSSVGAHLAAGTGPIVGLHRQEQRLNALPGIDVLHVRPGYFFENHLFAIGTIQALGVYADMTAPEVALPMSATEDIAAVVARELAGSAPGKRVLHLRAPKLYTMRECASILGAAVGRPDLAYVQAKPADVKPALMAHGFSAGTADLFEEMNEAFSKGRLNGEWEKGPTEVTPTPLEQFARTAFKQAFEAVPA